MSQAATAAGQVDGFRVGQTPSGLEKPTPTVNMDEETRLSEATRDVLGDDRGDAVVEGMRLANGAKEQWQAEKTQQVVNYLGSTFGLRLNQGAQGVVGLAIGIVATLMIGVVVLGRIDSFTPSLSGNWQNVQENTSKQAADTFDFMNLLPFLVVALFVLGIVMSRM